MTGLDTRATPSARPPRVDFGHRTVVVRRGPVAVRWRARTVIVCAILAVLAVAVTVWALMLGDYPLTLAQSVGGVDR